MTRSFNTLATVVITLVALLALGGASLKNFAFALLVGICSGGYHSIFFSAPLVLGFRKRQLEAAAKRRRAGLAQDRTRHRARARRNRRRCRAAAAWRAKISSPRAASAGRRPRPRAPSRRWRRSATARSATTTGCDRRRRTARERDESIIDPLDAQNAGLHDAALEQGHEEIALNFDDFDPSTSSGQGSEQARRRSADASP